MSVNEKYNENAICRYNELMMSINVESCFLISFVIKIYSENLNLAPK